MYYYINFSGSKSKNIIEIYSRAEELNNSENLKAGLNINCKVYGKKMNGGVLHTVFLPESSSSEDIIYINGLPISKYFLKTDGTLDYIMNFGDNISFF